jgi:myo-inositol 2-dehydrogenase/D-chiro-inositol 1-dehydrogenase
MDIFCDDGSLEYHLRKSVILSTAEGSQTWEVKNKCTIDMDSTFVEAVRTGDGSKIRSTYPDAVKSAELSIAANESLETGRVIHLSQWP